MEKQYDLVFEGGGAKGSVFVGALRVFDQEKCTFRRLLGTSAGAITATLLAAGYTPDELLDAVNERVGENGKIVNNGEGTPRFAGFMDVPDKFEDDVIQNSLLYAIFNEANVLPKFLGKYLDDFIFRGLNKIEPFREIFSFVERGGLYSGNTFVEWLEEKLEKKGCGKKTLKELHEATPTPPDLSLVITDTTSNVKRILNHRTAPYCPVSYAVRMSMSIPFVWQEVEWKSEWGLPSNLRKKIKIILSLKDAQGCGLEFFSDQVTYTLVGA